MIRVLIADDHDMVRQGLIALLENFEEFEVVADVGDGEMAVMIAQDVCPDVVLMDVKMPKMDGIEATRRMLEICPDVRIIMLTSHNEDNNVQDALQAGAISFMMKNVSIETLADAVRKAYRGEGTLTPEAVKSLIQASTRPPQIGYDLTDRELEVLELMVKGITNKEIGDVLFISPSTVKNHVSSILSKLSASSRTQAVAIAVDKQIVTPSDEVTSA